MSNLAIISLFAGVGGFDLAAHNAGIPTIAAVEIDDHARGVLAHRFPNTRLYTDVTKVSGIELKGDHDGDVVLTGGFPCQDLSVAGKRAGLAGERSGLFWHIIRICNEIQPKWLILENVPGLLSSNNGRDMGTVIGALVESGYGIAYRVLDAQYFGVPQRRRRVFIVGCFGDDGRASAEVLALIESSARNLETSESQGEDSARTPTDSAGKVSLLGSDRIGALCASDHKFPQQQQVHENKIVVQDRVFGQAGYGTYAPGVKTLNASMVKRPEDTVVIECNGS